jgi:hypothetical protein
MHLPASLLDYKPKELAVLFEALKESLKGVAGLKGDIWVIERSPDAGNPAKNHTQQSPKADEKTSQ